MQHHNPFTYFTDGVNSPSELNNLVPFSQFASDLANNALPQFSYIVSQLPGRCAQWHSESSGQLAEDEYRASDHELNIPTKRIAHHYI